MNQALSAHGIDLMAYDWIDIGRVSFMVGIGYIIKNFFSNEDEKVFGAIA